MDSLQLNIKRWYTDMNGVIQDKNTVPSAIQVKVPIFLFNEMDRAGGYRNMQFVKPVAGGLYFLYTYIVGASYNFLDFQIGNDIRKVLKTGDVVLVYGDDPVLPNNLCMIQISSDDQSYGSVLNNSKDKIFDAPKVSYFTDNKNNWGESIAIVNQDNLGVFKNDYIQPTSNLDPYAYFNQDFVDVLLPTKMSDKAGLAFYMLFDTDMIQLQFEFNSIISQFNSVNNNGNSSSTALLFRTN